LGLIAADGREVLATQLITLTTSSETYTFNDLTAQPIVSINRGFSAPVIIHQDQSDTDRAILLGHDTDPFNRWDAGRTLVAGVLCRMVTDGAPPDAGYLDGMLSALRDETLDPAYRAFLLSFPSEADTAQSLHAQGHTPDPDAIHLAHQTLRHALAEHLQDHLASLYAQMNVAGPYSPDATSAGKRDLGNAVLGLLTRLDGGKQAAAQYAAADNMTQQLAALAALIRNGHGTSELAAFGAQWNDDRLVMDKWFGLQVRASAPENTVDIVTKLSQHADFNHKNPNRFRAVFGAFAGHAAGFHRADGSGYALLADWLITLDAINPQTTARIVTAFESFRRYDDARQALMRAALERIAATPNLSRDVTEMVTRILAD
jgi:aminopeptidase N